MGGPPGPPGPPGAASAAQEYGGIALHGFIGSGNPSQALVAGVFSKIVNFNANMPSSGVTPQFASDQLTIDTSGDYFVFAGVSWAYSPIGNMRLVLFVNATIAFTIISGAKTFGFLPAMTDAQNLIPLLAGDVLDLRLRASVSSSVRVDSAQLYVERANP